MPAPKDEKHGSPIATEASTAAVSPDPAADATLPPTPARDAAGVSLHGEAVGRYLLGERIGEGGMGVVYSAYDPQLDRAVAVKLVRIEGEDRRGRDELKARLLREARAMARLSHPNVVAVYDAGEWKDRVFLAMELVRGATTLRAWLAAAPRGWREVVRVFRDAGRGISAAHAAGVVHRDVKPDNVLIDVDGRARITDFGIARAEDAAEPVEIAGVETPDVTRAGRVVGTPAYMAPEVLFGAPADERSDEFGFCVALHVALYGQRPYPDNRIREGAFVQVVDAPAGSRVPPPVRRVLLRGLSLRPEERYPTMDALLADLERVGARGWRGAAAAAGVVSVALVAMAVASRHPRESGLCGERRPLSGAWDSDTKAAIARAFESADVKNGAATWARAGQGLERTATEWQRALGSTCQAPSGGARLLQVACLERQRDRFRMLAGVLGKADADVVAHASAAAATLPRAAECESARGLSLASSLPEDPGARHEIAAIELEIAEASERADAGQLTQAIPSLISISSRAGAIGYRPLEADALFALGEAQDDAGEARDAISSLSRAEIAAEAAGDDRLAARAAAKLAYGAALASRVEERDAWLVRARAIMERLGPDERAASDVAFAEAWIAYDEGRNAESLASAQRSATLRARVLGSGHPDTLRAEGTIGVALTKLGRFEEAVAVYDATLKELDASLGPTHPGAVRLLTSEALLLVRLGRFDEADVALARALPIAESILGETAPRTIAYLAAASLRREQNRLDEALRFARLAEAAARGSTGETSGNYFAAVEAEGEIRLAQHDARGALDALSRATAIADDDSETNGVLGEALLAAGRPRDALKILGRANDELSSQLQYPGTAARIRFALARALVLTGGDRARARSLARAARDELAPFAWRRDRVEEIDRWLAVSGR